jgi:hypothetical protein
LGVSLTCQASSVNLVLNCCFNLFLFLIVFFFFLIIH